MKLGSNDISAVKIGSTDVSKVYIGSTEVWSSFTGLLDTYTGAAAAYSLRLLSSTYTGDAIRVRRASDNTEQDIGFVDNELDTSTLTSFCSGTNGFVKTWYDQSGNGYDATQTTAANQPQIVSSGSVILENGKPAIKNTGTTGLKTSILSFSSYTDLSFFSIQKIENTSGFKVIIESSPNFNSNVGAFYIAQNLPNYEITFRTSFYIQNKYQNVINGQSVLTSFLDSSQTGSAFSEMFGNSTNLSETNVLDSGLQGFTDQNMYLFARSGTSNGLIGNTQELILYPSDQSSNRTGIETNINDFYSIYP